jgi:hypothetical protein
VRVSILDNLEPFNADEALKVTGDQGYLMPQRGTADPQIITADSGVCAPICQWRGSSMAKPSLGTNTRRWNVSTR